MKYNLREIKTSQINTPELEEYKAIVLKKWGKVDHLPDNDVPYLLPMPLLAFYKDILVGGLSFSYFKHPTKDKDSLWINTVYIKKEYRGNGIASSVIRRAEEVFLKSDKNEIFVFTDKPLLYKKLGWDILSSQDKNYVLTKDKTTI